MKCSRCGTEYPDNYAACPSCGERNPGPARPFPGPPEDPHDAAATGRKSGVVPMVLGILGLVVPYVGLVLAIIAIVMGHGAREDNVRGSTDYNMATAGWVMGIIGVAIAAVTILMAVVGGIALFASVFS